MIHSYNDIIMNTNISINKAMWIIVYDGIDARPEYICIPRWKAIVKHILREYGYYVDE